MSSKRRYWLNTIADVVKKLSHYMGRNNIALRYLRGKIGVFPLKQSEEVHVVELESVLSVLLDSFARHNKKMNKKDLMKWFQKSTSILVDSDLASVVSDISDTSFESTSKSISGGKNTYPVANCQSLTKLKALKLKQTKDHYSITKNNFFLKTSDSNSNTSKLRHREAKKALPEIYTQSSITLRDELAKHIEERRKKEEERAAITIKSMRDHIRRNAQSYVNILKEEDNFSGMEDYIARKHNTIDKHDDLRSSFLKLGNEQEELRRKSKQKDQRDKVLEELSHYTTKTELQKNFMQD